MATSSSCSLRQIASLGVREVTTMSTRSLPACLCTLLLLLPLVNSSLNLADVPCGKIARGSRRFHARIMGGSPVKITDFPHAVSLRKNGRHFCGGALISKNFVLTAAHCVHSYPADVWTVAIGDQNSHDHEDHEREIGVTRILKHPKYRFPKYVYDLALMRLAEPVRWSQYAQPVCLPDPSQRTSRGLGYLAGWGFDGELNKGGMPTKDLHLAKLPIMDNEQCQEWFHSQGKDFTLRPEHLCAGFEWGKVDGCQGDSGGGLVSVKKDQLVLLGVMSAGIGCGREKLPGVYTRVEKFVSWVEGHVRNGEDD